MGATRSSLSPPWWALEIAEWGRHCQRRRKWASSMLSKQKNFLLVRGKETWNHTNSCWNWEDWNETLNNVLLLKIWNTILNSLKSCKEDTEAYTEVPPFIEGLYSCTIEITRVLSGKLRLSHQHSTDTPAASCIWISSLLNNALLLLQGSVQNTHSI